MFKLCCVCAYVSLHCYDSVDDVRARARRSVSTLNTRLPSHSLAAHLSTLCLTMRKQFYRPDSLYVFFFVISAFHSVTACRHEGAALWTLMHPLVYFEGGVAFLHHTRHACWRVESTCLGYDLGCFPGALPSAIRCPVRHAGQRRSRFSVARSGTKKTKQINV